MASHAFSIPHSGVLPHHPQLPGALVWMSSTKAPTASQAGTENASIPTYTRCTVTHTGASAACKVVAYSHPRCVACMPPHRIRATGRPPHIRCAQQLAHWPLPPTPSQAAPRCTCHIFCFKDWPLCLSEPWPAVLTGPLPRPGHTSHPCTCPLLHSLHQGYAPPNTSLLGSNYSANFDDAA